MDASEFPANAKNPPRKAKDGDAPKREEKKVKRVVTSEVTRRPKPLGKRFAETFVLGDMKSTSGHVVFDVMIPAAKDMLVDAGYEMLQRIFYGESRGGHRRGRGSSPANNSQVNYNKMSSSSYARRDESRPMSRRDRATHNFDEITLDHRSEAEEVLENLYELIGQYDVATVADLYDMIGTTSDFTDEKWGWTDLRGSGVHKTRYGYLLDLPKPSPIDS